MSHFENRIYGSILGLAIGDAFGAPVEFKARGTYPKVVEYMPGGEFNLPKGYWTDDTSLALCIIDSINKTKSFDLKSQMYNFRKWWHEGFMSSTGFCFDIGNTTKKALTKKAGRRRLLPCALGQTLKGRSSGTGREPSS